MPFPSPPAATDVEVVVMGKGVGESLLVHLPGGRWLVIDSFRGQAGATRTTDAPRPLSPT